MVITPVLHNKYKGLERVQIRIHDGGKDASFKSTGYKIKLKYWNKNGNIHKKNWVKTIHKDHQQINDKIYHMLTQIEGEMLGENEIEILKLKSNKKKFLDYFSEINSLTRNMSTRGNNRQSIKPLIKFLTENDISWLSFNDINKKFVTKYYNWLLDRYKNSSSNQYFGVFRTFYNRALEDENLKLKQPETHPFEKFKYAKSKAQSKFLPLEDLNKIKKFQPPNRKYKITKNIWLFQFVHGCRIFDIIFLQWNQLEFHDNEFYLDFFTNKSTDRVSRLLPLNVVELLVTGFEREYPEITNELNKIDEKIRGLEEHIKEIKTFTPTKDLTQDDFLRFVQQGKTTEFIQSKIDKIDEGKRILNNASEQLEGFLIEKKQIFGKHLRLLHQNHPNKFIWDKPNDEGFDISSNSDENSIKYKRCVSQNYGMLKQLRLKLNIPRLSSHMARHTASQTMIEQGITLHEVSQYLSHSHHSTTEIYISRLGIRNDKATTLLSSFLN